MHEKDVVIFFSSSVKTMQEIKQPMYGGQLMLRFIPIFLDASDNEFIKLPG